MIGSTIEFKVQAYRKSGIIIESSTHSGVVKDSVLLDGTTHYVVKTDDDIIVLVICSDVIRIY